MINAITALCLALTEYFKLKNKRLFFDTISNIDAKLDSLDEKREKLRSITTTESQARAEKIMGEILEEQKKKKLFLESFNK